MDPYSCKYVSNSGKSKGQRCTVRPRAGDFCSKHSKTRAAIHGSIDAIDPAETEASIKDANQAKLLDDPVFGDTIRSHTKKTAERSTVVMLTINTNKPLQSMSDGEKRAVKEFAADIFAPADVARWLSDKTHDSAAEVIDNVESDYRFEVSGKNLLHMHGIIKIYHHGFLRFNANDLRSYAKLKLGYNCYINSPISSDPVESWKRYMEKSQGAIEF